MPIEPNSNFAGCSLWYCFTALQLQCCSQDHLNQDQGMTNIRTVSTPRQDHDIEGLRQSQDQDQCESDPAWHTIKCTQKKPTMKYAITWHVIVCCASIRSSRWLITWKPSLSTEGVKQFYNTMQSWSCVNIQGSLLRQKRTNKNAVKSMSRQIVTTAPLRLGLGLDQGNVGLLMNILALRWH